MTSNDYYNLRKQEGREIRDIKLFERKLQKGKNLFIQIFAKNFIKLT